MFKIQPQYLPLSKLLKERLFCIPEYQRAYSWTTRQRQDLFEDLVKTNTKGKNESHFMAAVVCLRRGTKEIGTDEFQIMDIVDGQQRITTLIILLKTLSLLLNQNDKDEAKLSSELQELLVKPDGDELLLLQTNHDSSHYFEKYMRQGTSVDPNKAKTVSDREILAAIKDCRSFVEKWKKQGNSLISLGALLKNKLFFLLHEIHEEKTVYSVFEVLNSRGLTVSWLDRLKSILMGIAFELPKVNNDVLINDLHVKWRDIYSVIGLRQGLSTEALRFAATLYAKSAPNRPLSEEDAVSAFKDAASGEAKEVRKVATWVLDVTKACDAVVANNRLNAVTRIAQARLLAVAINLRSDFSDQDRKMVLAQWEKVTFRIYGMLGYDARTRVGDYVRLAWQVINNRLPVSEIISEIKTIGSDFSIKYAVDALRDENCYEGWEVELRYFMFRYEEYLSKKNGMKFSNEQWEKIWMASSSDSIEHIFPQSKSPAGLKHRLGNLVLLPPNLNSSLKDKDATDKAGDYIETGLLAAGRVATIINKNNKWKKSEIETWENELLKWAEVEWAD